MCITILTSLISTMRNRLQLLEKTRKSTNFSFFLWCFFFCFFGWWFFLVLAGGGGVAKNEIPWLRLFIHHEQEVQQLALSPTKTTIAAISRAPAQFPSSYLLWFVNHMIYQSPCSIIFQLLNFIWICLMHMLLELLPHHANNKFSVVLLVPNIFSSPEAFTIKTDNIIGQLRRQSCLKRGHPLSYL